MKLLSSLPYRRSDFTH